MKENEQKNLEHKNSEMDYILINNDKIDSICCESKEIKV